MFYRRRGNKLNFLPKHEQIDTLYEIDTQMESRSWPYRAESRQLQRIVKNYKVKNKRFLKTVKNKKGNVVDLNAEFLSFSDENGENEKFAVADTLVHHEGSQSSRPIQFGEFMPSKEEKLTESESQVNNRLEAKGCKSDSLRPSVASPAVQTTEDNLQQSYKELFQKDALTINLSQSKHCVHYEDKIDVVIKRDYGNLKILLHNVDLDSASTEYLKDIYGDNYIESCRFPRTLMILIKPLAKQRGCHYRKRCYVLVEYVYLTETCEANKKSKRHCKGSYTTSLMVSVYGLTKTQRAARTILQQRETQEDKLEITSIVDIILKHYCYENRSVSSTTHNADYEFVPDVILQTRKWKTTSVTLSEAADVMFESLISKYYISNGVKEKTGEAFGSPFTSDWKESFRADCIGKAVADDVFCCVVCFNECTLYNFSKVSVKPQVAWAVIATYTCHHLVCRVCWETYIKTRVTKGKHTIPCPVPECKSELDPVTIVSLSFGPVAGKYLQNLLEFEVQSSKTMRWCNRCDHLAMYEGQEENSLPAVFKDTPYVNCYCRSSWCFECGGERHWPASCEANRRYKKMVEQKVGLLYDSEGNDLTYKAFYKTCPFCRLKIEKSSGCNHMVCRCGNAFCWACLSPWDKHTNCHPVPLVLQVFSSLDVYQDSRLTKLQKLGLQLRAHSELFGWRFESSIAYKDLDAGKKDILSTAKNLNDHCSFLEYVVVGKLDSKSRHFNKRVTRYIKEIGLSLRKLRLQCGMTENANELNFNIISHLVKSTERSILKLRSFDIFI